MDFWLVLSKNDSNIICSSIKNESFLKIWRMWHILKICQSLPVHPRVVPGQPYDLDSLVLLNLYSTFYIRKSEYTLVLSTLMISHMVSQWAQMEEVSTMP